MAQQRNLLSVLGCSGSLVLVLSITPSALANSVELKTASEAHTLSTLTRADDNPIMDALSCSCARCVMGQTADL